MTKADGEVGRKLADIATKGFDVVGVRSAASETKSGDEVGEKPADIATKGGDEVGGKSADIATKGGDEVGGKPADIATKGGDKIGGKSADKATESDDAVGKQLKTQSNYGEVAGARSKRRHLYYVTGRRDINVPAGIPGDKKIWYIHDICDICQLPDGLMLIVDWGNRKLKLLDQSYTVIDHCNMPYRPVSVCVCDEEACVRLWDSKTLQFVSIQEKMKISRTMRLGHWCMGLVYRDGKMYVSDGHANIYVHNKAGNLLRVYNIYIEEDKYVGYECLKVSMDGRQLYITHGKYLICMDRQSGQVIWRVKGDNDSLYKGVCVDKDNNLMVCDRERGEIVQYSGDGEKLGVVVDGLIWPQAICFDQDNKTLLVGELDSDVIKMFNLK